jgi:hypothetical protein
MAWIAYMVAVFVVAAFMVGVFTIAYMQYSILLQLGKLQQPAKHASRVALLFCAALMCCIDSIYMPMRTHSFMLAQLQS